MSHAPYHVTAISALMATIAAVLVWQVWVSLCPNGVQFAGRHRRVEHRRSRFARRSPALRKALQARPRVNLFAEIGVPIIEWGMGCIILMVLVVLPVGLLIRG